MFFVSFICYFCICLTVFSCILLVVLSLYLLCDIVCFTSRVPWFPLICKITAFIQGFFSQRASTLKATFTHLHTVYRLVGLFLPFSCTSTHQWTHQRDHQTAALPPELLREVIVVVLDSPADIFSIFVLFLHLILVVSFTLFWISLSVFNPFQFCCAFNLFDVCLMPLCVFLVILCLCLAVSVSCCHFAVRVDFCLHLSCLLVYLKPFCIRLCSFSASLQVFWCFYI